MPNDVPDLSILIVNYKTPRLIVDCLRSVYEHTRDVQFEVLIIDNQSDDNSEAIVRATYPADQFPAIRWFDMGYNAGFSRANNLGIDNARGRTILLLNSDTLLIDNLIGRAVRILDEQADVAAVGAMQINREGQVHDQMYCWFNDLLRFSYIVPQKLQGWLKRRLPDPHYDDPNQVDWIIGAFLMTRRSTIEQAGKMDENFFLYGEDVEWSYRLGKQGRMLVLRDGFFVHLEYGSSESYQVQELSYINRFKTQLQLSNLLWIRKQYGIGAFLLLMAHYYTLIPILYIWKISVNLKQRKPLFSELSNQTAFAKQVGVFSRFFWKILFNRPGFYKV
ncbi:glycosyl transferase family 2 [Fibrella aestuarina BUZ 2]|uniref:Glycosyl transferase family 2 n=1 Tax=Fibrella aestuarina BUZ 2 TaxID=1166018 RepID=I0KEG7_9BACT|nr:glycosyltransferase family 2 protein [Fibrella aestuarina]CCH02520.1 glycosyl transferase family 2 [Fibrella aestuarina BUZ 2]